jgi:hypothetical protein
VLQADHERRQRFQVLIAVGCGIYRQLCPAQYQS